MEDFQLVPIKNVDAVAIFTGGGIDEILSTIEERVMSFVPDIKTARGRKDIASIAYKVSQSKTYLDGLGKDIVSDWKNKAKVVDSERKKARDFLDELKERVRQPLTDWERAEEERIAVHERNLEQIVSFSNQNSDDGSPLTAEELRGSMNALESIVVDYRWEEFEERANRAKEETLAKIKEVLARREQYEAEQAELARLRQEAADRAARDEEERIAKERSEREARIAAEAAERAKREAEEKAQRELEAAARREQELREAAERAERERVAAEARAKAEQEAAVREAERKAREESERIERERLAKEAAEKAEAERLSRNKAHQMRINKEVAADLQNNGVAPEMSIKIIDLVASGKIRNMAIAY